MRDRQVEMSLAPADTGVRATVDALSAGDFERLRVLIHTESGINLSSEKKTMLEIRLRRRFRELQFSSYAEYCKYLFSPANRDREMVHLIDAVTTNKTDFFREPDHFEYLFTRALPDLASRRGASRKSFIWSA
jgi:chemotaxis protein methyltransferase CheR